MEDKATQCYKKQAEKYKKKHQQEVAKNQSQLLVLIEKMINKEKAK